MDCNFTLRRDKSFADDLVVRHGRVRCRVALLLRAAERKPFTSDLLRDYTSPPLVIRPEGLTLKGICGGVLGGGFSSGIFPEELAAG